MKAPQYVITPLKKAKYYFGKDCCAGYSIKIYKRTRYEYASTLRSRCDKIITWCNKQVACSAEMVFCPSETRYDNQFAVITIYDPVMLYLEKYINC